MLKAPPPAPVGVLIALGMNADSAVQTNPPGTTFTFAAGTHRRQSIRPKAGDVFLGPGAILDGQNATAYAFRGYNGAAWVNDVTIRNLTYTRYKPPAQMGALWLGIDEANSTERWTVDSVYGHHNANLAIRIGNHARVLRSRFTYSTTINIGGVGKGVLVDGIESGWGNSGCQNDPGFESGGSKFVRTDSLVVRTSYFHDNCGVGLWLDIDNINYVLEANRVEDNYREGICTEISYRGVIRNNALARNGLQTDPYRGKGWLWDAAIGVHASSDVEVYGNTITGDMQGIVAIQQDRGSGRYGPYVVQNLWVHDNAVTNVMWYSAGAVRDVSDNLIFSRNNRWDTNHYTIRAQATTPFAWSDNSRTKLNWLSYGQDAGATFTP